MQFLILSHLEDRTAMQVYALLKKRHGAGNVKLVSSEELVYAQRWHHRLAKSAITSEVHLADGTLLRSENIGVVFNRLRTVSMPHFPREEDREYAAMEMHALLLSWLKSLPCPVINSASPQGLGAHAHSQFVWLALAARAGLSVRGCHLTTNSRRFPENGYVPHRRVYLAGGQETWQLEPTIVPSLGIQPVFYLEALHAERQKVLIAGERVLGALGQPYASELQQLRELTGCEVLQAEFGRPEASNSQDWKVTAVSAFPNAETMAEVNVLAALLEEKRSQFHKSDVTE